MSDPIVFPSSSPTVGLPLLVAGQAQKEFFVNQALCVLDALQSGVVTGSQPSPPASHAAGACFRVLAPASGAWTGHEDEIAASVGGDWHFVSPREGMQIFDQAAGRWLVFRSQEWRGAEAPVIPIGGTVQDNEARTAIAALIEALRGVGILGPAAPLT